MQTFLFAGRKNQDGVLLEERDVNMYLLQQHFFSTASCMQEPVWMGDVIPLTDVQQAIDIIPVFGQARNRDIDSTNALELSNTFYLNNFSSKELYHALLSNFA